MTNVLLDPTIVLTAGFLVAVIVLAGAALRAWQGWLDLKRQELGQVGVRPAAAEEGSGSNCPISKSVSASSKRSQAGWSCERGPQHRHPDRDRAWQRDCRGDQLEPQPVGGLGDHSRLFWLVLRDLPRADPSGRHKRLNSPFALERRPV